MRIPCHKEKVTKSNKYIEMIYFFMGKGKGIKQLK